MGLLAFYGGNKSQVYFISCARHMFPYICSMRVCVLSISSQKYHFHIYEHRTIISTNRHVNCTCRPIFVLFYFAGMSNLWNVLKCFGICSVFFFAFETNKFTLNDLKCIFYHLMIVIFSSLPFPYRFNYIESIVKKTAVAITTNNSRFIDLLRWGYMKTEISNIEWIYQRFHLLDVSWNAPSILSQK